MSDKKWIKARTWPDWPGSRAPAVSRTFTPGASVSERPAEVLSAAEALGYQVNIIARTMITGSSNFIGIVTAGFRQPVSRSKLLAPLVHQLALNGFMPLLMNADDPQQLAPRLNNCSSYPSPG